MGLKICVSDRCFFPWSAFVSTRRVVSLAKSLGYKQIEVHPTCTVWWEFKTKGKLSCKQADICSFHIDWGQDEIQAGLSWLKRGFNLANKLFPPTAIAIKTLQKLEKQYHKPVVIHWPKNIDEYQQPILELQDFLKLNFNDLQKQIKKGKLKGIVLDTYKYMGWLKRHRLQKKWQMILIDLFRYIREVHFRFKNNEDIKALFDGKPSMSIKVMKKLLSLGYKNRIVVEAGWPDAGQVSSLLQVKTAEVKKIHRRIIKWLING